ncbi:MULTISPECIES: 50S ribosomal protein L1 [Treponema]|jgi:ribosomal protein L1|uniref:Large ribosomal subunit protein uL1 n=4 Tax=Treponema denticola TaxID=158 RepID=RL1_TREDE|nr:MULTISPECIES: 50S ribosomal protein L1 [Treponema]Q73JJ4.1 RecName: Full=Large ribosomal subunit protein uL1; AltName: Full=50S ribosomal protein L1 [Treponema denticola ATCC 35405]AAS12942.1 ribosomal protein L1 [Treponema denticola ATCC 35405]EGC78036.1 50S ribosomal protein L1 [Treponema denticola F0402]EMB23692.1 50S ribosomal protein L1 [Treponema denticola OTK]EMB26390.1 50S ribosomal protein L1 [Treponema denticola SP37]EMB29911.1 50S ribosomal protein L1 [Treponema denticola MYR-T]
MKHGKNYKNALAKYDSAASYELPKAVDIVKELKYAKFDETVEVHVSLTLGKGQSVRDTLVLPHQFRGEKKVLVFCTDDRVKEALDAGAAYAGSTEYIEKVKGGWLDFDIAVATPDMMKDVGRLGMVLGRRGLMPNPKTGTVTTDIASAINELKKGRVEFRADKGGVVHLPVGKVSMDSSKIVENVQALINETMRKKPADAKGDYIRSVSISSTMGPGVWVDYKVGE